MRSTNLSHDGVVAEVSQHIASLFELGTESNGGMPAVRAALTLLHIGPAETFRGLSMFPIYARPVDTSNYLLLADAFEAGSVSIRELPLGDASYIEVENGSDHPVLITAGEELVGDRKRRITNRTFLVPPGSSTSVPRSYLEREQALECSTLDAFAQHFQAAPSHAGGIFTVGDHVCGMDLFDKPTTFASLLPKLVQGYGIAALELAPGKVSPPLVETVCAFLDDLAEGVFSEHDAAGLGCGASLITDHVVASGLVVDSTLIHLVALANPYRCVDCFDPTSNRY